MPLFLFSVYLCAYNATSTSIHIKGASPAGSFVQPQRMPRYLSHQGRNAGARTYLVSSEVVTCVVKCRGRQRPSCSGCTQASTKTNQQQAKRALSFKYNCRARIYCLHWSRACMLTLANATKTTLDMGNVEITVHGIPPLCDDVPMPSDEIVEGVNAGREAALAMIAL